MFINNDITPANYYSTMLQNTPTTVSAVNGLAIICLAGASANHTLEYILTYSPSGRHIAYGRGMFENIPFATGANVQAFSLSYAHNSNINITNLYFDQSSGTNGYGAGSSITIYKYDF
jgi:hypothetical protein